MPRNAAIAQGENELQRRVPRVFGRNVPQEADFRGQTNCRLASPGVETVVREYAVKKNRRRRKVPLETTEKTAA